MTPPSLYPTLFDRRQAAHAPANPLSLFLLDSPYQLLQHLQHAPTHLQHSGAQGTAAQAAGAVGAALTRWPPPRPATRRSRRRGRGRAGRAPCRPWRSCAPRNRPGGVCNKVLSAAGGRRAGAGRQTLPGCVAHRPTLRASRVSRRMVSAQWHQVSAGDTARAMHGPRHMPAPWTSSNRPRDLPPAPRLPCPPAMVSPNVLLLFKCVSMRPTSSGSSSFSSRWPCGV